MSDLVAALTALGEFVAGSKFVLLVVSLMVNVYQAMELRRINRERIIDLKEAGQRANQERTIMREVVGVLGAFNRKIGEGPGP